jgi:hypothetical protein
MFPGFARNSFEKLMQALAALQNGLVEGNQSTNRKKGMQKSRKMHALAVLKSSW